MAEQISLNVMIDPSLLVTDRALGRTLFFAETFSTEHNFNFYLPQSFIRLSESDLHPDNPAFQFFLQNAYPIKTEELAYTIKSYQRLFKAFEVSGESFDRNKDILIPLMDLLRKEGQEDDTVGKILCEEWVFLYEYSWIVSRIKKPFRRFVKVGAVSLEFGELAYNTLVRRTLHRSSIDDIHNIDRLRALGKWIAASGPSLFLFIPPVAAMPSAIGPYFLLFDPVVTDKQPYMNDFAPEN